MYDAMTNPPMPEWNGLPGWARMDISRLDELCTCPCCRDNSISVLYEEIRKVLRQREKEILSATMAGSVEYQVGN